MRISHLTSSELGIRCTLCMAQFPVRGRILGNPEKLLEVKESIAATHRCGRPAERNEIRVMRSEATAAQLDAYWLDAMQRLNASPMRGSR